MKQDEQKKLKESLTKKHMCYVLITCDAPSDDGNMNVEMSYEGDADLAAYLLQQGAQSFIPGAQSCIDEEDSEALLIETKTKIYRFN